jgi:hypothetical protein
VRSLVVLYRTFATETYLVRNIFTAATARLGSGSLEEQQARMAAEMSIVRLYASWGLFCRRLVIASATGRATTVGGLAIPGVPGVKRPRDVIPLLMGTYKRKKYEPEWAVAGDCIDAARRLNVANLTTLQAALGSVTSSANEIRVVRNFFAHRSDYSVRTIRAQPWYTADMKLNVEELLARPTAAGMVINSWIARLELVALAAVQ